MLNMNLLIKIINSFYFLYFFEYFFYHILRYSIEIFELDDCFYFKFYHKNVEISQKIINKKNIFGWKLVYLSKR